MKNPIVITLLMSINLFLFSCTESSSRKVITGKAQGTTFSLVYYSNTDLEIENDINVLLNKVDESLSTYDHESYISKWNRGDKLDSLNTYFKEMYLMSKKVNEISDGFFDPTVQPLSQYYGFEKKGQVLPNELDSILEFVGLKKLSLVNGRLIKEHPKVKLNFNAIAQGYTVDIISDYLLSRQIKDFVLELGGEVYCSGLKPKGESWVIGIDKPEDERGEELQNAITLSNLAITTSGNYRKWLRNPDTGKKYTHTINPKNGSSSPSDLLSVTVIHKSCAMADALSTTLLAMKYKTAIEFLRLEKVEAMFILEKNNEIVTEYFNGFERRIKD